MNPDLTESSTLFNFDIHFQPNPQKNSTEMIIPAILDDTNEAVKMESAIGQRRSSQSAEELPDWYYAFYGRNN